MYIPFLPGYNPVEHFSGKKKNKSWYLFLPKTLLESRYNLKALSTLVQFFSETNVQFSFLHRTISQYTSYSYLLRGYLGKCLPWKQAEEWAAGKSAVCPSRCTSGRQCSSVCPPHPSISHGTWGHVVRPGPAIDPLLTDQSLSFLISKVEYYLLHGQKCRWNRIYVRHRTGPSVSIQ